MKKSLALALATANAVLAQQSAYGQCGGTGWTGATTCVSGYYCSTINDYYSQCVPGTASTTSAVATSTLATSTTASTSRSSTSTAATATSTSSSSSGFVTTSGTQFNIDGEIGYFAGTNSYWIGFLTNNDDVDLVMDHLQESGLKILRVWGFNDVTSTSTSSVYYQAFTGSSPTINTGSNGLERLDYVVESAEAHGIKLIINFVNNWTDYGGIDAYVSYYGLASHQAWYTSSEAQAQYQKYIEAVVSRYETSTTIFAWELANEPRCNGCDTSVIYDWASTTSAYIKGLDSNHLVTLGDEGFAPSAGDGSYPYTEGEGVNFADNLNIDTLDFGTYHMYPTGWGQSEETFPEGWIQAHGAACVSANKPCLFEEYGSTDDIALEAEWQEISLSTDGNSADLFWQLGDTLSTGQTSDDGYTIYYGSSDWETLVTDHVADIEAAS